MGVFAGVGAAVGGIALPHIAWYVRELSSRPSRRGKNVVSIGSDVGLANATLQQRLVPVRLFHDFLVEEGDPAGDACWTHSQPAHAGDGYDAGLRRAELCSLTTADLDPGRRTLRVRAETTKGRRCSTPARAPPST